MKLYHFCPLEKNAFGHRLQNPLLAPLLKKSFRGPCPGLNQIWRDWDVLGCGGIGESIN